MTQEMQVLDDEVNLLDYGRVVWKRRLLVGLLTVTAVLTSMVWSLFLPKIYESTVTILPPVADSGMGGGMAVAASALGVGSLGMSLPGMPATPVDLFVAMLRSTSVAEQLVKQYDLVKFYEADQEEDAVKALEGNTKISVTKEKVIKITVEATEPKLAADLANAYVAGLERLNQKLALTKAGQHRLYIEKRLTEARTDLVAAEEALADFQSRSKAISLDQQAGAALKAAVELQARISADEVQMQVMKNYYTSDNPDVVKLKLELEELRQQLHTLESGKDGKGMLQGDRLHPAFVTVPSLGLEYTRLLRELKVQEAVYTMLASQYEQAQLMEAKDMPTVQVLDPAKPARRKSRPSIRLNMMIAGVLALFGGIFLAFFLEYLGRVRASQNSKADVVGS